MPRSARKPTQSRQNRSSVVEQSTPVVSMPETPATNFYAELEASKERFRERLREFVGNEDREEIHQHRLDLIGACIEILENDHGSSTPFEEFVHNVLLCYVSGVCTPESVREHLGQFEENFADSIRDARMMLKRHPELVNPPVEPAQAK